jgi:late competence protein required for DNA uptake (superfamily II DNA/RNA helicase)
MNFQRRIKVSKRKARCTVCGAIACRFIDTDHIRKWYCAECFQQKEKKDVEQKEIFGD